MLSITIDIALIKVKSKFMELLYIDMEFQVLQKQALLCLNGNYGLLRMKKM